MTPEILKLLRALLAFGAGAALYGGIVLVLRGYWMRKEALASHVALISALDPEPPFAAKMTAARRTASDPFERELTYRLVSSGVPVFLTRGLAKWIRPAAGATASAGVFLLGPYLPFLQGPTYPLAAACLLFGILGWFLPTAVGRQLHEHRIKKIIEGLPDALELLVVCVEAGLSLEAGLAKVVAELGDSEPALAEELAITLADLQLSPSRDEALMGLVHRVDAPAIRIVVSTLSQTMKYGTPLAHSIRSLAADMRKDLLLRIDERVNKLPVLMTIPMVLFILPTMFLVLMGPAALKIIDRWAP